MNQLEQRLVKGEGPRNARIIGLGESPWTTEAELERPFVGASGNLLNEIIRDAGGHRSQIYIDNVYPYKPPEPAPVGDRLRSVPTDTLVAWMRDLHRRIAELDDPHVIVPMGNYAMFALIGKGKVAKRVYDALGQPRTSTEAEERAGITKLRGSIYLYTDLHGRQIKVIPATHPAAILQNISWQARTVHDWARVFEEAQTKKLVMPERRIVIDPSPSEVAQFYQDAYAQGQALSIDIETWPGSIQCVGFARDAMHAIVLPTPNKAERAYWRPWIKMLCECELVKIGQNLNYDRYWLKQDMDVDAKNFVWDTMCMHHVLNPREEHKLEFLASIYTKQPYWKDEAKDAEEIIKFAQDTEALYHYNGLDCCVTHEISYRLWEELVERSLLQFYYRHYTALQEPLLQTMLHGMRIDKELHKKDARRMLAECNEIREKLKELAGEELYATDRKSRIRKPTKAEWERLITERGKKEIKQWPPVERPRPKYVNRAAAKELGYIMTRGEIREYREVLKKDFSGTKLRKFFYETLKVPKRRKRGSNTTTLDETALKKIAIHNSKQAGDAPRLVLKHRTLKREYDYVKGAWDADGRIRCTYKPVTEAGRLSSAKNPKRRGYNMQNVKRGDMRKGFLADEGCVLVRLDYSQIEDRMVKMYTRQPRMRELANLRPDEYDCHTENAKDLFEVAVPTKEQRYLAKRGVHAAERDMQGDKLSEVFLHDDYDVSPRKCTQLIEKFHAKNPEIREYYFKDVRQELMTKRKLVNSWGREWWIDDYERLSAEIYRKGYSYLPQAENADQLNQWGFIPAFWWLWKQFGKAPNAQVHDEVMASVPVEYAWAYASFLVPIMEQKREIAGGVLSVPVGVTVGMNYAEGKEWKVLPGRKEFEEGVYEVYYGDGDKGEVGR